MAEGSDGTSTTSFACTSQLAKPVAIEEKQHDEQHIQKLRLLWVLRMLPSTKNPTRFGHDAVYILRCLSVLRPNCRGESECSVFFLFNQIANGSSHFGSSSSRVEYIKAASQTPCLPLHAQPLPEFLASTLDVGPQTCRKLSTNCTAATLEVGSTPSEPELASKRQKTIELKAGSSRYKHIYIYI